MTDYSDGQVEKVLDSIDVRIGGEAPNDVIIFCPYHHNARTPAAEVSKDTGVFYCFACQKHASLVDLVRFTSHLSYFEALRLIDKYKDESSIVDSINAKLETQLVYERYDSAVIRKLYDGLTASNRAQDYLRGRGLTAQSMMEYYLGYSANLDMVTFPYYSPQENFIVGFQGRSIDGKEFKNSTGTNKSQTLFGIHLQTANVYCNFCLVINRLTLK